MIYTTSDLLNMVLDLPPEWRSPLAKTVSDLCVHGLGEEQAMTVELQLHVYHIAEKLASKGVIVERVGTWVWRRHGLPNHWAAESYPHAVIFAAKWLIDLELHPDRASQEG